MFALLYAMIVRPRSCLHIVKKKNLAEKVEIYKVQNRTIETIHISLQIQTKGSPDTLSKDKNNMEWVIRIIQDNGRRTNIGYHSRRIRWTLCESKQIPQQIETA